MTPHHTQRPSEQDVLMDFATDEDGTLAERLARYQESYPEHADALVTLAREFELMTVTPEPASVDLDDSAGDSIRERFDLIECRIGAEPKADQEGETAITAVADPFGSLDASSFRTIALKLGANLQFILRLRERSIHVHTISRGFLVRLARIVGAGVDDLVAYLSLPSGMDARTAFKSDGKPEVGDKTTFEEALELSRLSDSQKKALRAL